MAEHSGAADDAAEPAAGADPKPAADPHVRIRIEPVEVQRATVRVLVVVSAWLVAISVLGSARHFLFLILLAWLMAIAAEPAIRWFLRRGRSRGTATAIVGCTALVVLAGLFVLFGTAAFQQASQLVSQGPVVIDRVVAQLNDTFGLHLDPAAIAASLQIEPSTVQSVAENLGGGVLGVFGSLASVLFDLITVIVFAFYIAAAGPELVQKLAVWVPPERQRMLGELWDIADQKTGGYVASKVVLAAVSSVFYGTFFWLIGLPGWLPLALFVGIMAQFVPLIGTYFGIAIPVLVAVANRPVTAIWIVLFALVYQQVETYVFTPRVSQRTMNVNPAIALGSVFLGAAIWGPIGAIIGVPIAAVVVALAENYWPRHELTAELRAEGEDAPAAPAARPPAGLRFRRLLGAPRQRRPR